MKTRSTVRFVSAVCVVLGVVGLYGGCSGDPVSPRADALSVAQTREIQNGAAAFQKFLSASDVMISQDPSIRDRVLRVFVRVVEAAKSSSYGEVAGRLPWESVVVRDDQKVTGFAFPGGKVGLYTGLIHAAETDDQLAGALGHLVAKVLTRHRAEQISRNFMKQSGQDSGLGPRSKPSKTEELEKTWQRTQREEADYVGMLLSADAGYDPRGTIALYQRLEGADSPRAKKLEGHLAEAEARYQRKDKSTAPAGPK